MGDSELEVCFVGEEDDCIEIHKKYIVNMADENQALTSIENLTSTGNVPLSLAGADSDGRPTEIKSFEDIEQMLSATISTSVNAMKSLSEEYETNLVQLQSETLKQWKVCVQCLEKLTEAAAEVRNELIEKKESQMKNIQILAGVLNGFSDMDGKSEA